MTARFRLSSLLLTLFCLTVVAETRTTEARADETTTKGKRPITKLKFDPEAPKVELFQGMKDGNFAVKVIPKDEMGGNLLIENLTNKPLTVAMPDAFVGVQVLPQFGGCCAGGGGCLGCGGGGGGQGGGAQPFGGGGGQQGGGQQGGGLQGGGNFFSIPPEKMIKVPYTSVCLAHGKPDPHPRMNYRIVPVGKYTEDPVLQELIRAVGTGRVNKPAAQAAAWHLADKMSWQELAAKSVHLLGGQGDYPYFSRAELFGAQQLVAFSQAKAKARAQAETPAEETPPVVEPIRRTRRPIR